MRVLAVTAAVLFAFACKKKEAAPPPSSGSAMASVDASESPAPDSAAGSSGSAGSGSAAPDGSASATAGSGSATALTLEPLATALPPGTPSDLPRAADVLPGKEPTTASLVASGDSFRYQVPPDARATKQDGVPAYVELNEDIVPPVTRVFWVTTEPFAGNVKDFANRDRDALLARGATKVSVVTNTDGWVAGKPTTSSHLQLDFRATNRAESRTYAVEGGTAYIFHCATAPDGWALSATDCGIRGMALHVKPPAIKKKK